MRGYFGMREVSLGPVGPGNHPRPLLNGEFVFQIGMLDQVWPFKAAFDAMLAGLELLRKIDVKGTCCVLLVPDPAPELACSTASQQEPALTVLVSLEQLRGQAKQLLHIAWQQAC